eukprot:CAMPEP_0184490912 /NCGR_PEP_ID=MMETSP0113_2-20130426/19192_1 /TAXON_ID=91329 /ORGANISM="Norrisiella sphaerica, Strain BC52" /LENGTH=472 /DNA_ID=CAMNT_0026875039 /DNA_START=277 /DNA_END=1695 /DNA_ORIENTATION=+
MALSILRASIQYYWFEYNRSKTFRSLYVTSVTFAVSVVYLIVKLLYTLISKNGELVAVCLWGIFISVAEIVLYHCFRRKRIRARKGLDAEGGEVKMFSLNSHSRSHSDSMPDEELGGEIGQRDRGGGTAELKQDHMAYIETPLSLKEGAGIPPESLKEDDSLFMDCLDVRLHYKLWRSEDTKSQFDTTVLLHGFGGSTYGWREVWVPMQRTTSCLIAMDMPGAGLTSRPVGLHTREDPFSQKYACRLLFTVLDKLGVTSCRLVGHGMGGCLAVYAATQHPERVTMVTLISPMVFMDPFPKFIRDLFRTGVGKELLIALVRSQIGELVLRKAWYNKKRIPKASLTRYQNLVKVRDWHAALIRLSQAAPLKIGPSHFSALQCPVGIIHGEKDKIVPISNSKRLETNLRKLRAKENESPNSGAAVRVCRLHRVGHVPHEETPEEFMRAYEDLMGLWHGQQIEETRRSGEFKSAIV